MTSPTPAPPKFLYFDMGNVLLLFSHERACRQLAEVSGATVERVREVVFGSDLQRRYERGQIDDAEFHETFCRLSGTRPERDRLERAGSDIFEFNQPLAPLITGLARAGCRLGVLSNTCAAHWRYVTGGRFEMIERLFDVYALSFKLGSAKPEAAIFAAAAELAGLPAEEIFFTDDRPENVVAAREAGFQAMLFEGTEKLAAKLKTHGLKFHW